MNSSETNQSMNRMDGSVCATMAQPIAMSQQPNDLPGEWDRLEMSDRAGAVRFSVHVRPRSSRSAIVGVRDGSLDVALTSPPAEGAANEELRKLLARAFDVTRRDVNIIVGVASRSKLVEINGVSPTLARELLSKARR
jgi:uncharacterized protein (TIGR00251 family)